MLLDECVPRRLRNELPGHEVRTVPEMGWAGTRNGILLRRAEAELEVFLTTDRNLRNQQDLEQFSLTVVVLEAHRNKLAFLLPLVPEILVALELPQPGQVVRIQADPAPDPAAD